MSTQSVIKELRQKTSSGFSTPVKIGSEQKYVGTLLNSNNNNLEEQSILGVDCLTTIWEDSNIKYTTKKFFDGNPSHISADGYYILFIKEYSGSSTGTDFYFDGDNVYFPEVGVGGASFVQVSGSNYELECNRQDLYVFDNVTGALKINPELSNIIREEVLCLRTNISDMSDTINNLTDVLISKKTVTQTTDIQDKIHIQETIENYL